MQYLYGNSNACYNFSSVQLCNLHIQCMYVHKYSQCTCIINFSVCAAIIVGFQSPEYTFLESTPGGAPVFVIKSATVDDFFTVDVCASKTSHVYCLIFLLMSSTSFHFSPLFLPSYQSFTCSPLYTLSTADVPPNPPFVFPSAFEDLLAGTVLFSSGSGAPDIEPYDLVIQDDDVALEDNEVFTLSLGGQSDSRVQIGGTVGEVVYYDTTRVTILDDDCECICIIND